MTEQNATLISAVTTVGVPTGDHERALGFYAGTLGLTKQRDQTFGPGLRWVEVGTPHGGTTIALAPRRDGAPAAGVDTGIRLATPDAEAAHAHLRNNGVDVDAEILRIPGVPAMFSFRDPEGNTLYLVESSGPGGESA